MMNEVFPQGYAWLDGNFVELSKAKIPILDWGFCDLMPRMMLSMYGRVASLDWIYT